MTTQTTLSLTTEAREHLTALAESAYPNEACGALIGRGNDAGPSIHEVASAENLNRERAHDRYELNPVDLLKAEERAASTGAEVLGIWHTHPDHPAIPSETDRLAAWEGWSYIIVSVQKGRCDSIRSWRLVEDAFIEELIQP